MATSKSSVLLSHSPWLCWWCLRADHDPSRCDARPQPSMKDFETQRPAKTRGRTKKPKSQTTLSVVEAAKRRKAYLTAHKARTRELETRAKARALETIKRLTAPLLGWGPLGSFTTMQLLAIEFAVGLRDGAESVPCRALPTCIVSAHRGVLRRFKVLHTSS